MDTKKKLEKYCATVDILLNPRITLRKIGYNYDVYYLYTKTGRYVARVEKGKRDSGSSLENANTVQMFLKSKKINFVPKNVKYDREKGIHVETYVGTRDISIKKLDTKLLDCFMKQLSKVHSFQYREIRQFCIKNNFPMLGEITPLGSLQIFGIDRFEIVKKLCPDNKVIAWIKPKLEHNISFLKGMENKGKPFLQVGDLTDIRTDGTSTWIIDWEYTSISYGYELSYIKIHVRPSKEKFRTMVRLYAKHSGKLVSDLYEGMEVAERMTRLNDVTWAAMKWGETDNGIMKVGNNKGLSYEKLTRKRIKLYEDFVTSLKIRSKV